jgi:hypothetical protein
MARRYGRSAVGERCQSAEPHGHWQSSTFLAALRHDPITAPFFVAGAVDAEVFPAYLQHVLCPELQPGDVVILEQPVHPQDRSRGKAHHRLRSQRPVTFRLTVPTSPHRAGLRQAQGPLAPSRRPHPHPRRSYRGLGRRLAQLQPRALPQLLPSCQLCDSLTGNCSRPKTEHLWSADATFCATWVSGDDRAPKLVQSECEDSITTENQQPPNCKIGAVWRRSSVLFGRRMEDQTVREVCREHNVHESPSTAGSASKATSNRTIRKNLKELEKGARPVCRGGPIRASNRS